ncbi:uncharacterized protein ISCGN_002500 [Ixodes scapularis]
MPTVNQAFGLPGSAIIFLKLGAKSGFRQVRLFESCQEYMTFITPFGRFYYRCLPFAIKSAPEGFLSPMSLILEGIKGCVNMVDNILVFGRARLKPESGLQVALERLQQAGVILNASKCRLGVSPSSSSVCTLRKKGMDSPS